MKRDRDAGRGSMVGCVGFDDHIWHGARNTHTYEHTKRWNGVEIKQNCDTWINFKRNTRDYYEWWWMRMRAVLNKDWRIITSTSHVTMAHNVSWRQHVNKWMITVWSWVISEGWAFGAQNFEYKRNSVCDTNHTIIVAQSPKRNWAKQRGTNDTAMYKSIKIFAMKCMDVVDEETAENGRIHSFRWAREKFGRE